MAAYCAATDVRALDGFPDATVVPDLTVTGWTEQRAGELDVLMLAKGATVPVTAPPALVQMLKMANAYGAAAMLAAHPGNALGHDDLKGFVDTWLTEYIRLCGVLTSLSKEQLAAMGVPIATVTTITRTPPGMALSQSHLARECSDWRDAYPYIRVGDV